MRYSIKVIAATLALSSMMGTTANAEEQVSSSDDWPMGMSIAMQGDIALLNIQSSAASSIAQSIRQQMAGVLPAQQAVQSVADSGSIGNENEIAVLLASQ
ncbi:MAG: hypothetical protein ACSHXK_06615 [Oceanococcus sp.]